MTIAYALAFRTRGSRADDVPSARSSPRDRGTGVVRLPAEAACCCPARLAPADVLVGAPGPQSPGVADVRGHQRLAGSHVTRLQHPDHGAMLLSRGQQHAG